MGSRLIWCDDYSINIKSVDSEHKLLFGIFNDLLQTIELETNPDFRKSLIVSSLTQLRKHVSTHFESEEHFMQQNNYPALMEHQIEHRNLMVSIDEFINNYKRDIVSFDDKIVFFLKDWLVRHIILTDFKIGQYINSLPGSIPVQ